MIITFNNGYKKIIVKIKINPVKKSTNNYYHVLIIKTNKCNKNKLKNL
jgi:hypothetical protein